MLGSMKDLRGTKALIHDALDETTRLIEASHESVARNVMRVSDLVAPPMAQETLTTANEVRKQATAGFFGILRAANQLVRTLSDAGISMIPERPAPQAVPLRSDTEAWTIVGDAVVGAINGIVGDHLHARGNELDMKMRLRFMDAYLPETSSGMASALAKGITHPKLAVFVHGSCATEWAFSFNAEKWYGDAGASLGAMLERDEGFTPIYVRYNSGRHLKENGTDLARLLKELVAAWPVPIDDLTLVGHSMGGLVVRNACHLAELSGDAWVRQVKRVVCLGSPHQGAPLAKFGHVAGSVLGSIDHPATVIGARLVDGLSAGIRDLRYGLSPGVDAEGETTLDAPPLNPSIEWYFIAATAHSNANHFVSNAFGDMMVRPRSAEGPKQSGTARVHTVRIAGLKHHELSNHPAVYERLQEICSTT